MAVHLTAAILKGKGRIRSDEVSGLRLGDFFLAAPNGKPERQKVAQRTDFSSLEKCNQCSHSNVSGFVRRRRLTAGLHVYGGDLHAPPRSMWDGATLLEGSLDHMRDIRAIEAYNAHIGAVLG
jgi:hypothetical protein